MIEEPEGKFRDMVICHGCVYLPSGEPDLPSFCLVLSRDADGTRMCAATFVEE